MSTPSHDATFQKTLFGVGVQETSRSQDDLLHPRLEVDLQYSGSGPAGTTGSGATFRLDNTAFNQDIIRERILHLEASENAKHAEILRRDIRDAERERKTAQLEVTCENYRSRIVDLEHMLIQRNEALSENQRQMTTLNDALDDTLVELNKARVLQATAEQKRDEYALEIKHMHRESEKWSQEKAQLEARLQDLQLLNARLQDTRSTEAEWRLQLLERHATQAARIGELWALVTNHETLRTRDADDISTQTDVVYNEADVTYNEAGVFTNKTGIIYNETDVIYTELRALIANCETLQMSRYSSAWVPI
ncbi:uncharacterized protein LOC127874339 isoform X2 [Dreissena polymorpha]|uniref:Uncharacterized protein n=2 Tax=Dreissena polymorpha TaxID=45954 RepID=A0A9D4R0M6_DREPO|nr:uncharacterized protein LOC127874339 isoform X2 [Dreissena polymorpha]XP_052274551.1 uncharacterized protein LOC127874339 isoform X2 [Dreissena polymorpha]XP_052274552.1 uncharacterized protein LOC127874339 isoform X2 [Dreissena polymorpha]KAH3849778.1 hypothetical protein DPMN_092182 [Dreissena polymorpha]